MKLATMDHRTQPRRLATPNGRISSAWACTTAMTSGRASKIAAVDEALEIERALVVAHRLPVEA